MTVDNIKTGRLRRVGVLGDIHCEDDRLETALRFFEVYNGHEGMNLLGDETHAGVERMWDIVNTLRVGEMKAAPLYGLATDDSHTHYGGRGASPGRGWVMVRSRFLTPESLIRSMTAGDFYASTGVTLRDLRFSPESRTFALKIERKGSARYTTQFIGTLRGYDPTRTPVREPSGNSSGGR